MPQISEFCEIVGCKNLVYRAVDDWIEHGITSYLCREHYEMIYGGDDENIAMAKKETDAGV